MTEARCPFCSTPGDHSSAVAGQIVRCASCGKAFMVPSGGVTSANGGGPMLGSSAGPRPTASIANGPCGMPPHVEPQGVHPPERLAGAPAGIAVSPRSLGSDSQTPADPAHSTWLALCIFGGLGCLIIGGLLLVVLMVRVFHDGSSSPHGRAATEPTALRSSAAYRDGTPTERHTVIHRNMVAVAVQYAGFGEVRTRDANHRLVATREKNYLQIHLRIKNLRATPLDYTSWHGNAFRSLTGVARATLSDDQGRQYDSPQLANAAAIQGHTPRATLAEKEIVEDTVIFTIPSTVDRRAIRSFQLELPAAAYGGPGTYQFQIPASSIQGF